MHVWIKLSDHNPTMLSESAIKRLIALNESVVISVISGYFTSNQS